jgi:CPA2 family monovalent cation:H+ antiporter-2
MHAPAFLTELVAVFGVAVVVVLVLSRFRLPTIAGFIVAGALIGPSGFALVGGSDEAGTRQIESLAEVGVVLLLFTIGLEFSLARLRLIWRTIAMGGGLQVGLTIAAVLGATAAFGVSAPRGAFFGFLVAMSSTAIVLRALTERRETDAPHGRMIVGVLVFQDMCVIPMMLLVPMLAGEGGSAGQIAWALGKALLMVVGTVIVARVIAPRVLGIVARAQQRELFLLSVLLACLGIAWLTTLAGLSLALGAFLAGIALADSEYGHQALSDVLPFREAFTSLFFISIGMLFNVHVLIAQPLLVVGLALAVLVGKALIAAIASAAIGFPLRVAVLAGVGLAGIGEFSFVLAQAGHASGLLSTPEQQLFVAVSVITVVVTPIAFRLAPHLAAGATRLRRLEQLLGAYEAPAAAPGADGEQLAGHVVIAGYGVAGRLLGEALSATGVPYSITELNPETVRAARARGEIAHYGDITSAENCERLGIHQARELVLLINDPDAARRGLTTARRLAPDLPIVVRTKYIAEAPLLMALGATDVIAEELETAMEIVARVLRAAGVPRNVIAERLAHARRQGAPLERPMTVPRRMLGEIAELRELKIETFLVRQGDFAHDATIAELHLILAGTAFVVALGRKGETKTNPKAFESIQAGDVIYLVVGTKAEGVIELLGRGPE